MPSHSDPSARKIDPKYPVPTSDVLQWSQQELGMLVHFNMATFIDSDGCNYDPNLVPSINLFNPYLINTDQWAQTIAAFGAKYAVLVAKHNCGFAIWPTKVAFPEAGFVYNYSVANSPTSWFDVVGNFVKSCQAQGIKTGFYYSVVVNNWLNVQNGKVQGNPSPQQANITQELYDKIVLAQLTELWENYGQNGLEEIWFDGGYTDELKPNITSLLNTAQPHAAVFNGFGVSNNPVRWIGSEFGVAPDPTWSTGTTNDGGDPDSPIWCPAECDTTLQENDRWFWGENATLRSLDDMIKVYHQTVGHNCQLMLDLTPDRTGLIPSEYAQLYKQLGDFIQRCYSTPVVQVTNIDGLLAYLTIQPTQTTNDPFTFDRLVIQEDQTYGQRIRSYSIEAYPVGGNEWVHLLSGTSVGNKKIELLSAPMTVYAVRLTVSSTVDTPIIRNFAAHLC